jgi:RNA polymerase sigma-70 factor (ECF subfamily)
VKVYQNLADFRGESRLSTWLYRLATNLCLDHFRKKSSRQKKVTESLDIPVSVRREESCECQVCEDMAELPADEATIKTEMNACIRSYIDQLPENYRTVIILSELQGLKDREIAEILDCSLETVKIRLHRARRRLKETLEMNCTFYHDGNNNLCCDKN